MAVSGQKFYSFIKELCKGTHDGWTTADADTVKVMLVNTAPLLTNTQKSNLTEIATGNGYSGAIDIQNLWSESNGILTITATDVTVTASGGSIGPFRYWVTFNEDAPNDEVINFYDRGSPLTLNDGQSTTLNFGSSFMQIA